MEFLYSILKRRNICIGSPLYVIKTKTVAQMKYFQSTSGVDRDKLVIQTLFDAMGMQCFQINS